MSLKVGLLLYLAYISSYQCLFWKINTFQIPKENKQKPSENEPLKNLHIISAICLIFVKFLLCSRHLGLVREGVDIMISKIDLIPDLLEQRFLIGAKVYA